MEQKRRVLPCWACFKLVSRLPRRGKQTQPHKCPHGTVWCIAGTISGNQGMNGPAHGGQNWCAECVLAYNEHWKRKAGD